MKTHRQAIPTAEQTTQRDTRSVASADDGSNQQAPARQARLTLAADARSDQRILDVICEHLYYSHYVDVGDISVDVQHGKVRLEGRVSSREMKQCIEDIVRGCAGVREIDNRIRGGRDSLEIQDQEPSPPSGSLSSVVNTPSVVIGPPIPGEPSDS